MPLQSLDHATSETEIAVRCTQRRSGGICLMFLNLVGWALNLVRYFKTVNRDVGGLYDRGFLVGFATKRL